MLNNKLFALTLFALTYVATSDMMVGGPKELAGEELQKAIESLDTYLADVTATGSDVPNFTDLKVLKVTSQVVAGKYLVYYVELANGGETKSCVVKVWTRPWLQENATNVKIQCDGDDDVLDHTL